MADIGVLWRARELVRNGWHRGGYAVTEPGPANEETMVTPLDPAATCFCARGAIRRALAEQMGEKLGKDEWGSGACQQAEDRLALFVGTHALEREGPRYSCDLASANDRLGVTADDVIGWFDKAIAVAEGMLPNGRFTRYELRPVILDGPNVIPMHHIDEAQDRARDRTVAWALYGVSHHRAATHIGDFDTEAGALQVYAAMTGKLDAPRGCYRELPL